MQYGLFEYQMMSFGLSNASASFKDCINKILAEKLDISMIVHLDDILISTDDTGPGHVKAVRSVFEQLRKHSLYINLKKCWFYLDEICFLSYVISLRGIRMENRKIIAVRN